MAKKNKKLSNLGQLRKNLFGGSTSVQPEVIPAEPAPKYIYRGEPIDIAGDFKRHVKEIEKPVMMPKEYKEVPKPSVVVTPPTKPHESQEIKENKEKRVNDGLVETAKNIATEKLQTNPREALKPASLGNVWEEALVAFAPIAAGILTGGTTLPTGKIGLQSQQKYLDTIKREEDRADKFAMFNAKGAKDFHLEEKKALARYKKMLEGDGIKDEEELKVMMKLMDSHSGKNTTRDTQDVVNSYSKIRRIGGRTPSMVGDLTLVFNYMKMTDPGSVVRESEFRTAAQARAWLSRMDEEGRRLPSFIVEGIQKISGDGTLLPEQRQDFLDSAHEVYLAQRGRQVGVDKQYEGLAKTYGLKHPEKSYIDYKGDYDSPVIAPPPKSRGIKGKSLIIKSGKKAEEYTTEEINKMNQAELEEYLNL